MHSLTRHSFLIFVVFHHPLQQLSVCLVFRLAVRSAHLFSMPRRGARRASSVVLLSPGFRLRLAKGTTWLSLRVGINHQRRTVRLKLNFPVHST